MKSIIVCALIYAFTAQTTPAPTPAQQLQEVQAENQKLREQLAASQKRVGELEAAANQPSTAPQTAPAGNTAPTNADATADLMGNPIAVLDFLQKKVSEDMAKRRVALPLETDSKSARQLYLVEAKKWIDSMNRATPYSVEWRGRIVELAVAVAGNRTFEFQCVSADNKRNFGRVFSATILGANAPQLGDTLPDHTTIWRMIGALSPTLFVEPEMLTPNTFDNPPLVGPCVAFKFQVKPLRLFVEKGAQPTPPK